MNNKHSLIIAAILFIFLLVGNSCSKSKDAVPDTSTNVSILNMSYSPSPLTVAKGAVVKWTNTDGTAHTVTSNDGTSFNSGSISAGGTYSYTTTVAGTFDYHCSIHGIAMSGVLIVNP